MAQIQEPVMGLKPITEPKKYGIYQCAADLAAKIPRFGPVLLASGYVVNHTYTDTAILGVALHHVDAAPGAIVDIIVCDDPEQIYEATFDAAVVRADIGSYAPSVVTPANVNDHSGTLLDESEIGVAAATKLFQIVGLGKTVDGATTKAHVKIVPSQVDLEIPTS